MKKVFLVLSFLAMVQGFSISGQSSRRKVLEGASASVAATLLFPSIARADITNKVASSVAVRKVKSAQKQLNTLELYVVDDQLVELKQAIREPPLSEIRKSGTTLVRGGEDGPDAEKLATLYQKFIGTLEKLDNEAGLAIRGRKLNEGQLLGDYKDCVVALGDFVVVADESALIPIQNGDETVNQSS